MLKFLKTAGKLLLDGLFLCALAEIYYSRPQAVKHSRRANFQVGRTAFEKWRAAGDGFLFREAIDIWQAEELLLLN